jgi:TolA-binding protein
MTGLRNSHRPLLVALVLALAVPGLPALAQTAAPDPAAEARLRKLEAEMRALQRIVFPGGDGKFFPPQVQSAAGAAPVAGTPATSPVADVLTRMEALEQQIARLTAQTEVNTNKLSLLEAQVAALRPAATAPAASATAATDGNLAAMTGGASVPKPAPSSGAGTPARPPAATGPSATRLAAVRAVPKPATDDPADDEYSYGFRLWEAKFYPESQQQLKLFLQKYPSHSRVSYARNLLGRTYLDEGNPREAASWFLQNYQDKKPGDRKPDSLLFLAESMRQLKDTQRACVALGQFASDFPREAAGRLNAQYDATRAGVKCN